MGKVVPISTPQDFGAELSKAIKHKNRLVMEIKDMYTTYLSVDIIQKNPDSDK